MLQANNGQCWIYPNVRQAKIFAKFHGIDFAPENVLSNFIYMTNFSLELSGDSWKASFHVI